MEVRQLHYFLTLCEELNYTRAAQRLYLSRQALRQNIAALEQELGEPLFLNQRNHISLTERGEWLRQHAAPVVKSFEQLQQELAATLRPAGPVCFGVSQALLPDYLPRLPYQLELLQTVYPNFQLEIQLLSNDEILRGLAEGRLALGLVMDQSSAVYPFEKRILRQDPFCLMAAQGHPAAGFAIPEAAPLPPAVAVREVTHLEVDMEAVLGRNHKRKPRHAQAGPGRPQAAPKPAKQRPQPGQFDAPIPVALEGLGFGALRKGGAEG